MKSCEREADHGEVARNAGTRALLSDLSKAGIGKEIAALKRQLLSEQGSLLPPIEIYSFKNSEGQCSRFSSDLATTLKAQSALDGNIDISSLAAAVEGALISHTAGMVLEIKGHVASECPRGEAAEYMRAVNSNARLIPFCSLASELVAGTSEKELKPKKSSLDLDENIS